MEQKFSNHLINETSPYLLQHAHNPVNWYPWGEEALQKAKSENKPILVSIGYAACHWCHVMEHESFEDEEVAKIMNEKFINIKIDREERPDLDHIYMDAVQAMTGSGGWPLNVFLTPEKKPFFGGTYFPPRPAYNRPSWKEVLFGISDSFKKKKSEIESQADNLIAHLDQANYFGNKKNDRIENDFVNVFSNQNLDLIYENIMKISDRSQGGFGHAPKFPQTFSIHYLLHYYYFTKNENALHQACLSLNKMVSGGIYDQIGGGFARYSTDGEWLVPHFEKMLYDNALLIIVLSEAYLITKTELYRQTIQETIRFVKRELCSPEYGFYSSLDADSDGEEGKYYVWDKAAIDEILKNDSALFCEFFGISEKGNWEGKNILNVKLSMEEFAAKKNLDVKILSDLLNASKENLLNERSKRNAPRLDNKIILSWNALMNIALCKAYMAFDNVAYKELAIDNMSFLLQNLKGTETHLYHHCNTNGRSKFPAFLDDYSYLIAALIQLQEITADTFYLLTAKEITEYVIENFSDSENRQFFYTHREQTDIVLRKKEIYDGATPSGNAIMFFNLAYLSVIFGIPLWKQRAVDGCRNMIRVVTAYPTSFGVWATLVQAIAYDIPEIIISGKKRSDEFNILERKIFHTFIPYKIYQSVTKENLQFPLTVNKATTEKPHIYLCKNDSCQKPTAEIEEFERQLISVQKINN